MHASGPRQQEDCPTGSKVSCGTGVAFFGYALTIFNNPALSSWMIDDDENRHRFIRLFYRVQRRMSNIDVCDSKNKLRLRYGWIVGEAFL